MHTHDTHSCNRGVQLCLAMLAALHLLHSDYLASVKFAAADNAAAPCAAALTKGECTEDANRLQQSRKHSRSQPTQEASLRQRLHS